MRALLDGVFLAACSSHRMLNIPCQLFLACQVFVEKFPVNLIFLPIMFKDLLSLAALRIFSLALEFANFSIKYRGVELMLLTLRGFYLLDLNACFLPQVRKFSAMNF